MHTPGHGGVKNAPLALFGDALRYDVTELAGLESLYSGAGAIARSEEWAADVLGVKKLLYSAGGSTLCIQAMLCMAAPSGGRVIFAGSLHKSAINASILLGIEPVFIDELNDDTCENVAALLEKNRDVKAVYITNPDYYGRIYNSAELAEICRKYNIPLLVDGAHGAHLCCLDESVNTLHMGASMTAQSAHKTLPALTGGAWLCVQDERYLHKAKYAMSLFGSTSPSYLILLSLEQCVNWLAEEGRACFSRTAALCGNVRRLASELGCGVPSGLSDPARITLDVSPLGWSGDDAAAYFADMGVTPEMNDARCVVFIPSPFYGEGEFDRLSRALRSMTKRAAVTDAAPDSFGNGIKMAMSLREAALVPCEETDISCAAGRTAAEVICPCPPGMPVTVPGALIGGREISLLKRYGILRVKVVK